MSEKVEKPSGEGVAREATDVVLRNCPIYSNDAAGITIGPDQPVVLPEPAIVVNTRILDGVREYDEGYPVELRRDPETGRQVITAWNEGNNNCTSIDLLDLLEWVRKHPELIDGGQ